MDERVKGLWLGELRNPANRQTQGVLASEHGKCCLGLLCELYRKDTGKGSWGEAIEQGVTIDRNDGGHTHCNHEECRPFLVDGYSARGVPPGPVLTWAGLTFVAAQAFANLNDAYGMSFMGIAQEVESDTCEAEANYHPNFAEIGAYEPPAV